MLFNKVNTHEANELLDEIEPILPKYKSSDIGVVCVGILTKIVHNATRDKREDMMYDITKLIRNGVEHLDTMKERK